MSSFIDNFNYNRNKITDGTLSTTVTDVLKSYVDHAYGFRKIHPDYTGYCCRIARSSDSAEIDVKFDSSGLFSLDSEGFTTGSPAESTGSLRNWVGSNSGDLTIIYDQGNIGQNNLSEQINLEYYTGYVYRNPASSYTTVRDASHTNPIIISGGLLLTNNGSPTAKLTGSGVMAFNGGYESDGTPSGLHSTGGVSETFLVGMISGTGTNNEGNLTATDTANGGGSSSQYKVNQLLGGHIFGYIEDLQIGEIDDQFVFYYENTNSNGYAITGGPVVYNQTQLWSSFTNTTEAGFKVKNFRQTGQFDAGVEVRPKPVSSDKTPKYIGLGGKFAFSPTGADVGKGEFQELIFSTQTLTDSQRLGIENYMASYFNFFSLDTASLTNEEKSNLGFDLFVPTYGAQMSFQAQNSSWKGSSFYQFTSPMGLNNLTCKSKLSFVNNLNKTKKLLNYIESVTTGAITGEQAFTGNLNYVNFGAAKNGIELALDTGYYRNFSGSQIVDYTITDLSSDVYKIDISLVNNTISPALNNGMAFVNDLTISKESSSGFSKFDVVNGTGSNEFKWYCFENATGDAAIPFTGTTIHEEFFDGTSSAVKVNPVSKPTGVSMTVAAGKVLRGTQYFHVMQTGQQHRFVPFSASGKTFGFFETRYDPHEIFVLSLENGATVKLYDNEPNGVNGNIDASLTLDAGQTGSFTVTSIENHAIIIESNKNILCSKKGDPGDNKILSPAAVDIYRRRHGYEKSIINSPPATDNTYYVSDPSGAFASEQGDGAGGDAAGHLGYDELTNFAAWGDELVDYAIVSPFSGSIDISYYSGDSWQILNTHTLTGTKTDPHYVFRNGDGDNGIGGAGNNFNSSSLWKFESTCPVAIWINDQGEDEEVLYGAKNIIGDGGNILDSYFYITEDRDAVGPSLGEAGFTGGNGATRTFFWEPDRTVALTINHANRFTNFKSSFSKQVNISDNQNNLNQFELTFTNRSQKEAYSILHFLESHLGNKHFVYYHNNDAINKNRVFYCPRWDHTFVYKDSNTIKATFVEIVAPTLPI